jgi:hypothetical protein
MLGAELTADHLKPVNIFADVFTEEEKSQQGPLSFVLGYSSLTDEELAILITRSILENKPLGINLSKLVKDVLTSKSYPITVEYLIDVAKSDNLSVLISFIDMFVKQQDSQSTFDKHKGFWTGADGIFDDIKVKLDSLPKEIKDMCRVDTPCKDQNPELINTELLIELVLKFAFGLIDEEMHETGLLHRCETFKDAIETSCGRSLKDQNIESALNGIELSVDVILDQVKGHWESTHYAGAWSIFQRALRALSPDELKAFFMIWTGSSVLTRAMLGESRREYGEKATLKITFISDDDTMSFINIHTCANSMEINVKAFKTFEELLVLIRHEIGDTKGLHMSTMGGGSNKLTNFINNLQHII